VRFLRKEDGDLFQLENGTGFLLLEVGWDNEPGAGSQSWSPVDGGGQSWTPVSGSNQTWTEVDDND
jgi:hypothetical protein